MARISVEEGSPLHFCPNPWIFHRRFTSCWPIPSTIDGACGRSSIKGAKCQLIGRSWLDSLLLSCRNWNQLWLSVLYRILRGQLHRKYFIESMLQPMRAYTIKGIVIWAVLDPANPFVAPSSAPFVIGMAYANMVWGFANVTISTNLARDLGTRIVAAIFFGGDAFNAYAPIAIFVNVPATLFATAVYEIIMRDSFAIIAKGHNVRSNFLNSSPYATFPSEYKCRNSFFSW